MGYCRGIGASGHISRSLPWDGIFCIGTVERISGISEGQPYQRHYPEPYFANALSADERDAGSWTCGYGTSGGEDTWVSSRERMLSTGEQTSGTCDTAGADRIKKSASGSGNDNCRDSRSVRDS